MDLRFLRSLYENAPDDDRGRYVPLLRAPLAAV
jgi:hypothetical protein